MMLQKENLLRNGTEADVIQFSLYFQWFCCIFYCFKIKFLIPLNANRKKREILNSHFIKRKFIEKKTEQKINTQHDVFNVAAAINSFHYNQQKLTTIFQQSLLIIFFAIVLFICNCLIKHFIIKPELIILNTK